MFFDGSHYIHCKFLKFSDNLSRSCYKNNFQNNKCKSNCEFYELTCKYDIERDGCIPYWDYESFCKDYCEDLRCFLIRYELFRMFYIKNNDVYSFKQIVNFFCNEIIINQMIKNKQFKEENNGC